MSGVVVDQVSYRYTRAQNAIRDVSFEIPDGALVGVFGPNGAGKSTLLQCVAGLFAPTTGSVRIGGVNSAH
jgi:ABC-type multidrug transport system ATPase subunit